MELNTRYQQGQRTLIFAHLSDYIAPFLVLSSFALEARKTGHSPRFPMAPIRGYPNHQETKQWSGPGEPL